jgi:hypothetical protein
MARSCIHCERAEDLSQDPARERVRVELRPYGPGGALVCFECAMKPEHRQETDRQFAERLARIGGSIVLTERGPAPYVKGEN